MPFAYYERLLTPEKLVYQVSDHVPAIRLPAPAALHDSVAGVKAALAEGRPAAIAAAVQSLADALLDQLEVEPVAIAVLEVRPRQSGAELHGLYAREPGVRPLVRVWMRTAAHARVVAFRTFLRTLLHELCHHLDYELLGLPLSFHTLGFFKRETSLFHQLVPAARTRRAGPAH